MFKIVIVLILMTITDYFFLFLGLIRWVWDVLRNPKDEGDIAFEEDIRISSMPGIISQKYLRNLKKRRRKAHLKDLIRP